MRVLAYKVLHCLFIMLVKVGMNNYLNICPDQRVICLLPLNRKQLEEMRSIGYIAIIKWVYVGFGFLLFKNSKKQLII